MAADVRSSVAVEFGVGEWRVAVAGPARRAAGSQLRPRGVVIRIDEGVCARLKAMGGQTAGARVFCATMARALPQAAERSGILYHVRDNLYGWSEAEASAGAAGAAGDAGQAGYAVEAVEGVESGYILGSSAADCLERWRVAVAPSPRCEALAAAFLAARYYDTVYGQNVPLSYFPKTALARLRNMCDTPAAVVAHLRAVCVPVAELDRRHEGAVLAREAGVGAEEAARAQFIAQHAAALKRGGDDAARLATSLKVRETQLQIVCLLELLAAWLRDAGAAASEQDFFAARLRLQERARQQAQRLPKPRLVRSRRAKRTIVPTFLGMGVPAAASAPTAATPDDTAEFVYSTLNALVDRIGIWDTLFADKEDGLHEFLAYVLVPYYNKRLPETLKWVIERVKGRVRSARRSRSVRSGAGAGADAAEVPEGAAGVSVSASAASALRDRLRRALRTTLRPLLALGDLPAIKRSKSSVVSSRHLEKRQVDFSTPAADDSLTRTSSTLESFIFGAKRTKLTPARETEMLVQVSATPRKLKRAEGAALAPPKPVPPPQQSSFGALPPPQVFATPSTQRHIVLATPEVTAAAAAPRRTPMYDRLMQTSDVRAVDSSPVSAIGSSPIQRRPGEPLAVSNSPFSNAIDGQATDEDSDYERLVPPPKFAFGRATKTYKSRRS